jgi:hypothetical protein
MMGDDESGSAWIETSAAYEAAHDRVSRSASGKRSTSYFKLRQGLLKVLDAPVRYVCGN